MRKSTLGLTAVAALLTAVPALPATASTGTANAPGSAGSAAVSASAAVAAPAAATVPGLAVRRGHRDLTFPVVAKTTGEALLDVSAAAPGTDWAVKGKESAVVSISVDGRYVSDLVATGETPHEAGFGLGRLTKGVHKVRLHFAPERSSATAREVQVGVPRIRSYAPSTNPDDLGLALRFAPILYGRSLADYGSLYQNATTDTPLLMWHEATPGSTPGTTHLTYSVIWSNEDGGTNTPALMARWGRTTDIEWIYSLDVDAQGRRVAGSDTFQAPSHQTTRFAGAYEGDHPVLQTCTSNNNVCDTVDAATLDHGMRFQLAADQVLPAGKAREYMMDTNPWTYPQMAREMQREGKIEPAGPDTAQTPEVSDQRNYLYAVVEKHTDGANTGSSWVGVALGVRLKGGSTVYVSNHVDPTWSIQRDVPAATTVELPAGTTADDIVEVTARRVVVGTDSGAAVHVTGIQRGFLLGQDDVPGASFLTWNGDTTLTADQPSAVLWSRSG